MIRRQTTNLLQIFCEISLHSQVILKSMKVADDISRGTLECEWVNTTEWCVSSSDHSVVLCPCPLLKEEFPASLPGLGSLMKSESGTCMACPLLKRTAPHNFISATLRLVLLLSKRHRGLTEKVRLFESKKIDLLFV